MAEEKKMICGGCQKEIYNYAYIMEDGQEICDDCFNEKHKEEIERGIEPLMEPKKTLVSFWCKNPACRKKTWIYLSDLKYLADGEVLCVHCGYKTANRRFPILRKIHLLGSIRTAVWIMAIIQLTIIGFAIINFIIIFIMHHFYMR